MITQESVKHLFHYDDVLGILLWKNPCKRKPQLTGLPAGTVCSAGIVRIKLNRKVHKAHRLIWLYNYGKFPDKFIDHVDGNPSNNKLVNLRECSPEQNMHNLKLSARNTTGYKGVCLVNGKYRAMATLGGIKHFLGLYDTPEEASGVYNKFCVENHGKFYRNTTE